MASVSGAQTSRTLLDIIPQYSKTKIEVGSVRLKSIVAVGSLQSTTSRFPKLEECAHFHYDHVDLQPIQLIVIEEDHVKSDLDGITLRVTSGNDSWQIRRTYEHFVKLDEQMHQCVFDRKFSELPALNRLSPKTNVETHLLLDKYVKRLSSIGSGCAISCGPVLSWFELDNRGRRIVASGHGINTPAVAAAFATTPYTAHATDELSFQIGDMISVIDMPPAEESSWWRGKRGFVVGFFPSNCVAVITDKIPNEIALAEPTKPVLRKHGKLIAFFRAFILSRPSRRRLKQSGILKERVFGCDLSEHLLNSGRDIPLVLKCCAEFIEAHGIVDGIYRLSGVTSNIQRLRSIFDEDRIPVLAEDSVIKQDIHGVASLLKMYFRELPNPLCTYQLYDEFVAAVQSPNDQRLENMRKVVQKLPPPHYRTLEYLMGHLGRVCDHSSGTGMTARNVAIVWAPNLLRCRSLDQGVAALQGVGVQAVVTEFLILYSPIIFNNQPSDTIHMRPKSLAVCSPTKLLSLKEAQARTQHSPTQISVTEISERDSSQPNYHTIIDLPRKRQPFSNWRTIFTPRRNLQVKSPRRLKRKSVVKSAEFLGTASNAGSGGIQITSGPPTSTHSRSVSHDSYFDTAIDHLQSSVSLVETQHEGLSLSLDLSELQMNFDIEESEMRIFSEDETNQLFSSGASIVFGALEQEFNLEQRFSNQELRYIDSYSPDPMEGSVDSPVTPGYQPLLPTPTPNSFENLKPIPPESSSVSSRKSEISPIGYEKLAESPLSSLPTTDQLVQKKENDLYEPCTEGSAPLTSIANVYECMELENESYEPVTCAAEVHNENVLYENDIAAEAAKLSPIESNIYEEVQFTRNDIYEQVSNFRNSVNEVNKLVVDSSPSRKPEVPVKMELQSTSDVGDSFKSHKDYDEADMIDRDEKPNESLGEKPLNKTESSDNSLIQFEETARETDFCCAKQKENDESHLRLSREIGELSSNSAQQVQINTDATKVPERGDKLYDSTITDYENVRFTSETKNDEFRSLPKGDVSMKGTVSEDDKSELSNVPNLNNNLVCDSNLSYSRIKTDIDLRPSEKDEPLRQSEAQEAKTIDKTTLKHSCTVVSEVLKRDWDGKSKETSQKPTPPSSLSLMKDGDDESSKMENLRRVFEKDPSYNTSPVGEAARFKLSPLGVDEAGKPISGESDAERRERIEKYKEERRNFFRNKYKTDTLNNNEERDDELIRRIKQKTKIKDSRESDEALLFQRRRSSMDCDSKKSPTKVTVNISYSPTKSRAPLGFDGTVESEHSDDIVQESVKKKEDTAK